MVSRLAWFRGNFSVTSEAYSLPSPSLLLQQSKKRRTEVPVHPVTKASYTIQKLNLAAACMMRAGAAPTTLPKVELPIFPSTADGPVKFA